MKKRNETNVICPECSHDVAWIVMERELNQTNGIMQWIAIIKVLQCVKCKVIWEDD